MVNGQEAGGQQQGDDLFEFLSGYAKELEDEAGQADPELREKIALLQRTINSRDSVVRETVQRVENGGISEVLKQLNSMEEAVASIEHDIQDDRVLGFLAEARPMLQGVLSLDGSTYQVHEGEEQNKTIPEGEVDNGEQAADEQGDTKADLRNLKLN
ncbi:hypothetical protein GUITHDRAFT_152863 [Guillardia theta CCMP2712]|uniref:Uncharacterized protein n=1 Tax=Guillardia theta (strain CCMP2712) TaxID=905079 RepID=L1J8C2_GUITC|nr:hypothetical protein GUITHDRAFT_152863 [Guillardia theta CCMP2712]EKX44783.1 hypothetical protein GUITHDRAFT_152863 [Guillardia theta CCMP2712]|mmetsp:Transcript_29485/g.94556  ORF Transcript_29485/g.94556 Transcript_29485/m.94556 type:complete len:157 (-) Transcript_29485:197-667(-)|eukprot:XP_005831763.1 hypothetical protein GUITHDRAFT_152863 [Guillardia theta CCMP2712]